MVKTQIGVTVQQRIGDRVNLQRCVEIQAVFIKHAQGHELLRRVEQARNPAEAHQEMAGVALNCFGSLAVSCNLSKVAGDAAKDAAEADPEFFSTWMVTFK